MKYLWMVILFTVLPLYASSAANMEKVSIKTSVIFNTQCAKCHEGECSGRLSFDTGSKAASSHIGRYSGDVNITKKKTKEFFSLLNYMKTECALWMPGINKLKLENFSRFALPSSKGYFIPLGTLEEGNYHIKIQLKENMHFDFEILSDHFKHFLDVSVCPDKKQIFQFIIDRTVNTFLRIKSRIPLEVIDINLKKINK